MNRTRCRNVVVISDTHFGCRLGLCPPETPKLDEGDTHKHSALQAVVWGWWERFWNEWVPTQTKGEPFILVHNGDCIDGKHHDSVTQISHNIRDQHTIGEAVMKPIVDRAEAYYHIRGTEAHVGPSAQYEEMLAKTLKARHDAEGRHARWELWLKLGDHLIHFLHHIGFTSSSAHEVSAVNAELTAELVEAARWGDRPPRIIVRSHRHRSSEIRLPLAGGGYMTAAVTPAWQLKTPFTFKVAGARLGPPQIGGLLIRLDSDGNPYTQTFVRHIKRPAACRV